MGATAKVHSGGQTATRWTSFLGPDPVISRASTSVDLHKALCFGDIFVVSIVISSKISHLGYHLRTVNRPGTDGVRDHELQDWLTYSSCLFKTEPD